MGTAVEHVPDRIYVHQLNLTSADVARRQREKEMVEEQARKVKETKEIKRRQREEEKRRDMEMLLTYNPWEGRIKKDDPKRKKNPDGQDVPPEGVILQMGRPGHGAPVRTKSGRLLTQLAGDPDIRFQDAQLVRLSIENQLRYKKEDKENYRRTNDELIRKKQELQEKEREWENKKLQEMRELYPFGKDRDNGGSYLSHTDSLFMPTNPKRIVIKDKDFDPWGKGFGNPDRDRLGNVHRHKFTPSTDLGIPDDQLVQGLGFRRNAGGNGAPHLTESGHPRTRLRKTMRNFKAMGPHIDDSAEAYNPWGKPGGGAPFQREELDWSLSGHPREKDLDAKSEYRDTLQQEMDEQRKKKEKERLEILEPCVDVATIISKGAGARACKDSVTGNLLRSPRRLTDVTQDRLDIRRTKSEDSLAYHSELAQQAASRQQARLRQKLAESAQTKQHMATWESFWGRPGHGAPRDPSNHKKENIDKLLQGEQAQPYVRRYVTEVVPSKHRNRYDLPTENFLAVKRDYEFTTPFPATEV